MARLLAMISLLAILTLGALTVNGNPADAKFDPAVDCFTLRWNRMQFNKCRPELDIDVDEGITVDFVYFAANEICRSRNKSITCMNKAMKPCNNFLELKQITETSVGFCDEGKVASVMSDFFNNNSGQSVNNTCLEAATDEIHKRFGRPQLPKSYPTTLSERLALMKSFLTWYVDRFLSMEPSETIDACNGMTRQTVYGVMLAIVSVTLGWGFDVYPDFIAIVQPPPNPWDV